MAAFNTVRSLCIAGLLLIVQQSSTELQRSGTRIGSCEAFRAAPRFQRSQPTPRAIPSASLVPKMSSAATESTAIPNWRLLCKDEFDVESVLAVHPRWSESEYNASLALYDRLVSCADSYVAPGIKDALNSLEHACRLYGPESVICSYNGGKDAVAILHLVRAARAQYYRTMREVDPSVSPSRPRVVYFDHQDEFPEILSLLHMTVENFDLDMVAFEQGVSFSEGLKILVEKNIPTDASTPFPMAFVLGTRTTDPNAGSQGQFAPSSHYMPPFMRVNPILEWTYGHVWHFLRLFQLPYCCLYDMGFTSLGTIKDTVPCPALAVAGSKWNTTSSVPKYWPAYMLRDWDQERAGRIPKNKLNQKKVKPKSGPDKPAVAKGTTRGPSPTSSFSTVSALGAGEIKDPRLGAADVPPSPIGHDSNPSYSSDGAQRSVGLLVIGDEILKGLTADTNTHTAAKSLREQNVPLRRVVVVSDDQDAIVAEIRRMQNEVDVIITSGGVGPTHDDVTIKSVAVALDRELSLNEEMAQLLRQKMNGGDELHDLTEAQVKMATLPSPSNLRYLTENNSDWPVLQCRNIFVLPGVPEFFAKKIESLSTYLSSQLERSVSYRVVLSVDEPSIVQVLNSVVKNHTQVIFGSYPFVSHPEVKTVVTLEGRMVAGGISRNSTLFLDRKNLGNMQTIFSKEQMDLHVREALDELISALPDGSILRVENNDGVLFT